MAFPIGALVVGWLGERVQKMRYATSVLLLLLGQGIVVVLGLMWFRSIVPVEQGWLTPWLAWPRHHGQNGTWGLGSVLWGGF